MEISRSQRLRSACGARVAAALLLWLVLAPAAALATPVNFAILFSNIKATVTALNQPTVGTLVGSDVVQASGILTVDFSDLFGSPQMQIVADTLAFTELDLTLDAGSSGGIVISSLGLTGDLLGGPFAGTSVPPAATDDFRIDFGVAALPLSFSGGTLQITPVGGVSLVIDPSTIDLATDPISTTPGAGSVATLRGDDLGGGLFDLVLVIPVGGATLVPVSGVNPSPIFAPSGLIRGFAFGVTVPEPQALPLLLLCVAGLGRRRRLSPLA